MADSVVKTPRATLPRQDERLPVSVSPEVDEVISVAFDLRRPDIRIYRALLDCRRATTSELADAVGLDRSNVNRALRRLCDRDIVARQQRLLRGGGYCYVYTASDVDEAHERLGEGINEWAERACQQIRGVLAGER